MPEQTRSKRTRAASPHVPTSWPALTRPDASPAVRSGTYSGGQSLDRHMQAEMSARFGHDFSHVRIHTDARAGESASVLGANAYTLGADIVFGEGNYVPGSPDTERLLAHELTHVVQQAQRGPGNEGRASRRQDASEREAGSLSRRVASGQSVQVEAAPQAALARDEDDGGGFFSSLASGIKSAAVGAYDGYEKMTDFKALQSGSKDPKIAEESKGHWYESLATGGMNGGIDAVEKKAAEGNQLMVDQSKGHWYEGLAKADAWAMDKSTEATGGLIKGVGDLGMGLVNTVAHPLDAAAGIEGIAEHNMTVPGLGSMLKAGHGAYDILSGKKDGEYGSSWGQLADHVLNPMTQMKDDAKFDTDLATGIIAPDKNKDGTTDWSAWKNKPAEAAMRALTNIAPIALGIGEAAAGDGAAEAANAAKGIEPPTVTVPEPPTVLEPHPFEAPPGGELKPITPAPAEFPIPDKPAPGGPSGLATDPHAPAGSAGAEPLEPNPRALPEPREPSNSPGSNTPAEPADAKTPKDFTDQDIDDWADGLDKGKASSGNMFELPGKNPVTGEGLNKSVIKADESKNIAYHQNMDFKGIQDAPGGKVEVRYHSENPNAPAGSYSHDNPTVQINSGKQYRLPNGEYKTIKDMTDVERDQAHYRTTSEAKPPNPPGYSDPDLTMD